MFGGKLDSDLPLGGGVWPTAGVIIGPPILHLIPPIGRTLGWCLSLAQSVTSSLLSFFSPLGPWEFWLGTKKIGLFRLSVKNSMQFSMSSTGRNWWEGPSRRESGNSKNKKRR